MPLTTGFYSNQPIPMPTLSFAPPPASGLSTTDGGIASVQPPPIPDLFARYQPPAVVQGAPGFRTAPQPTFQTNPNPAPQEPPAGQPGAPGAAALAQAALLWSMLSQGPNGFYGRAGMGPGAAQGFSLLNDPSIAGLFDPANAWKPSLLGGQVQGYDPFRVRGLYGTPVQRQQGRTASGVNGALAPTPDAYDAAVTFLRGLLGLA